MKRFRLALCLMLALGGCHRHSQSGDDADTSGGEDENEHTDVTPSICPHGDGLEVTAFDTNNDHEPDVVRVFRVIGTGAEQRKVLICREADLNGDGSRDVVRYYSDEGRPLREQTDRDFDGHPDEWDYFEDGRVIRVEIDSNGDQRVDTKTFYANGQPIRIERDMAGRSRGDEWHPDRWEYYEAGRMIRIGVDSDGDGRVDRWDRDEIWQDERRRQQAAELAAQQSQVQGEAGDSSEDESSTQ